MPTTFMLAAQAVERGRIECIEAPVPESRPGHLLVRTEMASICGSDLHVVGFGWEIHEWPTPPGHPGHEAVGRVIEPANGFAEGDLVLTVPHIWNSMCFAGYQSIDLPHTLRLPPDAQITEVLMAQQLGTVIFAAKRLPESLAGMTCAVLGQGSAGLFWNHVLKRRGAARIIAVDPVAHRLSVGKRYGADDSVDVTGVPATEAVLDLTGGQGAEVVIEAVGSTETLNQSFRIVRPEGTVALFGLPESSEPVPFDYSTMFKKRVNAFTVLGAQDEPGLASFAEAMDWISGREIDVRPIMTHTFPIEKIGDAFTLAGNRADGVVKVGLSF